MNIPLFAAFTLIMFAACVGENSREYRASEFSSQTLPSASDYQYCEDESVAMNRVGAYVYATLRDRRFPGSDRSVAGPKLFVPLCLRPEDFESRFRFSDVITGWQDTPRQVKVRFENGKTIQFCFSGIAYDISVVHAKECPEHPQQLLENAARICVDQKSK